MSLHPHRGSCLCLNHQGLYPFLPIPRIRRYLPPLSLIPRPPWDTMHPSSTLRSHISQFPRRRRYQRAIHHFRLRLPSTHNRHSLTRSLRLRPRRLYYPMDMLFHPRQPQQLLHKHIKGLYLHRHHLRIALLFLHPVITQVRGLFLKNLRRCTGINRLIRRIPYLHLVVRHTN